MINYLLCIALGAVMAEVVFYFTKKPTNVFTSKYQRMSAEARRDLMQDYQYELGYWVRILEMNIQFVSIVGKGSDEVNHYGQKPLILKLKTFAVQRIDAIQDILDEIEKAS